MRNIIKLYYAKPAHYFDPGTEADLVEDYRDGSGMFLGLRDGKWQHIVCRFSEFKVKVLPEQDTRSVRGLNG